MTTPLREGCSECHTCRGTTNEKEPPLLERWRNPDADIYPRRVVFFSMLGSKAAKRFGRNAFTRWCWWVTDRIGPTKLENKWWEFKHRHHT